MRTSAPSTKKSCIPARNVDERVHVHEGVVSKSDERGSQIVILGAGTAGTMMANKLVRALPESDYHITVVDRDDLHVYQPGLLLLAFGQYRKEDLIRPRTRLIDHRIEVKLAEIDRVAPDESRVYLQGGARIDYDLLIVATGLRPRSGRTDHLHLT